MIKFLLNGKRLMLFSIGMIFVLSIVVLLSHFLDYSISSGWFAFAYVVAVSLTAVGLIIDFKDEVND